MGKLRGKQHWQRVDADIRRTAEHIRAEQKAEQRALIAQRQEQAKQAALPPVNPAELAGARVVRDRNGVWHEVVRVNKTTVSVKTGYSWVDRIPHARIVQVSHR